MRSTDCTYSCRNLPTCFQLEAGFQTVLREISVPRDYLPDSRLNPTRYPKVHALIFLDYGTSDLLIKIRLRFPNFD
ncbi:hypothetical protein TSAR_011942 [Trichomalopsis sarcophagae]|uniref:Uncharacterized protein n=1 Tax=Trichomalopsis sarcophagae TaxID=543379 RepID=A0A232EM56_9HYME|nr:hypothetical protein TSAR_011942 [Trichomalopsis sarcophagae]